MHLGVALVVAWAGFAALGAVFLLHGAVMLVRRCPQLAGLRLPEPASWPSLAVVVPACDEAAAVESGLASLLAQDYPALAIVVVDDRSTDGTGAIIDRVAAADPRVSAIHLREVPAGWLGKVHALQRGYERVDADFVLFTDADVQFAPGVLRRAIAWAEAERLDHVAVVAEVRCPSFWVAACLAAAMRGILALARPWETADPRSPRAVGTGAFNLVRRSAFERTPGFAWLRVEVADDVGLGVMMKGAGGRAGLALGRGAIRHDAYATFADAARGLEKNGFAQAARFSLGRGLGMAALGVVSALAPFAAFLPVGVPWLPTVGVITLLVVGVAMGILARALGGPLGWALLSCPLGDLAMAWVIARATVLGVRRGGLVWRGTVYPTAALRAGRRVAM